MTYSPPEISLDDPVFVNTYGPSSIGMWAHSQRQNAPASNTWAATNRIFYIPFWLNAPYLLQRYWWLNGATVGTNNLQAGVYDQDFVQIDECTSTLSAGANAVQYVTPGSPVALPKMRGWLALWCNGTTATVFKLTSTETQRPMAYIETNAGGLPATGTPAGSALGIPVFGFTRRSSP